MKKYEVFLCWTNADSVSMLVTESLDEAVAKCHELTEGHDLCNSTSPEMDRHPSFYCLVTDVTDPENPEDIFSTKTYWE